MMDSVERDSNWQHLLAKLSTVGSHWIEFNIEVSGLTSRRVAETICERLSKATADDNFTTKSSVEPVKALPKRRFADIEGFKHVFVKDLLDGPPDRNIQILCWLKSRPRDLGAMLFLPVCDSTGTIQVVVEKSKVPYWAEIRAWKAESSIIISGTVRASRGSREIVAQEVAIVSRSNRLLHPEIRKLDRNLLAQHNTDRLLASRHLYLRNPVLVALDLYRSKFMFSIHQWFRDHRFIDFSAPLITPSLLYESKSAIHISNLKANKPLYLSQFAGFYLEAAAHAHERVYNLGPSFRNESRTNRHLMEYWHIKAELCSGQMDDIMGFGGNISPGSFRSHVSKHKGVGGIAWNDASMHSNPLPKSILPTCDRDTKMPKKLLSVLTEYLQARRGIAYKALLWPRLDHAQASGIRTISVLCPSNRRLN